MYRYKDGNMDVTIILGHITSIYYCEGADTFDVYLTDSGEPNIIPATFYDDFMYRLTSYVKGRNQ